MHRRGWFVLYYNTVRHRPLERSWLCLWIFPKKARYVRSSHQRCLIKKVFLEISQNSPESTYTRVFSLLKLQSFMSAFLLKKRPWHWHFSMILKNLLRTSFLHTTSGRLLLTCKKKQINNRNNIMVIIHNNSFYIFPHFEKSKLEGNKKQGARRPGNPDLFFQTFY